MPMKKYMNNILIYIAALLGLIAFIGLFATPLQIYSPIKGTWATFNVKAYLGETVKDSAGEMYENCKGTIAPIFGFILPFLMSIILIIESFRPEWSAKLAVINTILALLFFACAILVLLTKELWLAANGYGDTILIRNGGGPVSSAICSGAAGVILLVVSWMPRKKKEIDFIEK